MVLRSGIPLPTVAAHPPGPVPSEGRRTQNGGLLFRRSAACGETLRTQVLSWHFVDTARPPDGVRGPLGGQPRPRPSPRPNLNEAPPFGVAPPLSPPPSSPLARSLSRCRDLPPNSSPRAVVLTVCRIAANRRWRGARRPAGTAGVRPRGLEGGS